MKKIIARVVLACCTALPCSAQSAVPPVIEYWKTPALTPIHVWVTPEGRKCRLTTTMKSSEIVGRLESLVPTAERGKRIDVKERQQIRDCSGRDTQTRYDSVTITLTQNECFPQITGVSVSWAGDNCPEFTPGTGYGAPVSFTPICGCDAGCKLPEGILKLNIDLTQTQEACKLAVRPPSAQFFIMPDGRRVNTRLLQKSGNDTADKDFLFAIPERFEVQPGGGTWLVEMAGQVHCLSK